MNHVILSGRLTKDPEIRYTSNNKAVASLTLAVDDGKDKDGERKTQYIPCVAWEKTAELIDKHFLKGDPLTVIGKISVRSYEKDGQKKYVTEVVVNGIEFPMTRRRDDAAPAPSGAFSVLDDDGGQLPF